MKTLYIVRSPSNNTSFESNPELGLHFIESAVEIGFLNNVVFNEKLKLLVNQKTGDQWVGMATVWFILIEEKPLSNRSLEDAYVYIKNIGNQLFKVTRLGQSFTYKDIYSIPNVSDSWNIQDTNISYTENGGFKEVYCIDRNSPIGQEGEETIYKADGKSVKADLVFCVGSESQRTQSQFVHITMPSQNIKIDASGLRISGDINLLADFHNVEKYRSTKGLIYELFNTAITTANIFTSYLLLFQIIELVVSEGPASKINQNTITEVLNRVRETNLVDEVFITRLDGILKGMKKETSSELLRSGLSALMKGVVIEGLDFSAFPNWRKFRGKITHPMQTQALTDSDFVEQYKSLRKFVDAFVFAMP
jgi:hypothetical protein